MYQISEAHGMGTEVTSAAVDPTGTRMASGGYDGKSLLLQGAVPHTVGQHLICK